jgi:hypothetical protein
MLYNLIGDIHGRDAWRQLVREDAVNIFLGDYFDPYHYDDINPGEQELANLLDIIEFKQQHPETILLLGNHEYHYLSDERYSRYNDLYADRFAQCLLQHWHLFQVAYAIGKRILVSHAGVTQPWCQMVGIKEGLSAHDLMQAINDRMNDEYTRSLFGVEHGLDPFDSCGMSATASPLWVRPQSLARYGCLINDEGKEIIQIVGHTQSYEVILTPPLIFVDCLGESIQSLLVSYTENGRYDFDVYAPQV